MGKFYITTPIYYVNASPHIGHAYTSIIADAMTRYRRMKGDEVFFLTGTDEHGEKVKEAAQACGEEVQPFVDRVSQNFKNLWEKLSVRYDFFIRTTQESHIAVVREVIMRLQEKGDIYKDTYRAFYCVPCESFWTDMQAKESEGCPTCKRAVETIEEENYFFRLSKYAGWLGEHLRNNPECVQPKIRYNEIVGFLENNPLSDLCISRPKSRVSWGIEFPLDAEYVVYVWFDALINYISGVGCFSDNQRFDTWWPADVHLIGKDILRHHGVFWPIMLKALDIESPRVIVAHGWWKMDQEKISKSRGNIVNPFELIKSLSPVLGDNACAAVDALRYFLLREVPVGADGNFSWEALTQRINADLANDLGNLVFRTLTMSEKYFNGHIESSSVQIPPVLADSLLELQKNYPQAMDKSEFSGACVYIFKVISTMNKYIEDVKPWALWKEKNVTELGDFLYALLEGVRIVSLYIYPIMPHTAGAIQRQLGLESSSFSLEHISWGSNKSFTIKKELPLFPRIDSERASQTNVN